MRGVDGRFSKSLRETPMAAHITGEVPGRCGLLGTWLSNPSQDNAWEPRCDAGPVRDAIGAAVIDSGVGSAGDTAGSTTTSDGVSRMGTSGSREVWTGVSRLGKGDESSAAGASFSDSAIVADDRRRWVGVKGGGALEAARPAMADSLRDCDCDRSGPPRVFTPSLGCGDEAAPVPVDPLEPVVSAKATTGRQATAAPMPSATASAPTRPTHSAASDCAMIEACARASRRERSGSPADSFRRCRPWVAIRR